jgi:hypothetical protein
MSYKVTLFNYYASGEREYIQCDTESTLLQDARMDAEIEMFTQRLHNGRDPHEIPDKQVFYAWPTLGYRG